MRMQSCMGMGWLVVVCCHLLLFHFSPSDSLCHPGDSLALLRFKASFIVYTTQYEYPNNYYNYYYNYYGACHHIYYPKTETWENGTDCCSWFGVTCNPISGHVTGLDLTCSGLYGEIHPNSTLFHLSGLQSLNLAFNVLFQSPFPSLFEGLVSLTHLNLSTTAINGEIPSQISRLSKLQSLDLSGNYWLKWEESSWKGLLQNATLLKELVLNATDLSSTSMRSLNLSSSLVTLSLKGTRLWGKLTDDILCLPNLRYLNLEENYNLSGQLPNLTCSASSLMVLALARCQFQGSIPPSFSNLTHLTALDLSFNVLHGSIPSSLLTLPHLTLLFLRDNYLSGQIPNVFHHSSLLEKLDLRDNNIGGEFPSSLSNLQHLAGLDLGFNKLEGSLPNKLTGFSNLMALFLDGNLLNGTLPSWCFSLPSMIYLDLSVNQFTGHIPTISSYSFTYLSLCYNNLQGNVPESIFSLGNLTGLCLSSNNFSGAINFSRFSKFQNLTALFLSKLSQLSLSFESNVNDSFSNLEQLDLSFMGLTEFPKLSGKVPNLIILDLSNNKLHGAVPSWLHEIESLGALVLANNSLTTPIDQFSRNYLLGYLDLAHNLLTGGISSSICNASRIRVVVLSYNKLTGIIPQCLLNIPSLQVLDLQMNNFSGLPNTFSNNSELTVLTLGDNQLEGILPESLSNCASLEVLNLGNNQIEDTFPHWLQSLPFLEVLILRGNKLHGPISDLKTKHGFPKLVVFDISSNNFRGPIPRAYLKSFEAMKNPIQDEVNGSSQRYIEVQLINLGNYFAFASLIAKGIAIPFNRIPINLANIDLSGNKFEGEIPNVIGELHELIWLNLSHNRISGPIRQSMGNLTKLESLDLSSNMITGGIPTELVNLNFLTFLNLSHNYLTGEIPQGKQFNTFTNDSYEGNLGLCGSPLSMKCGNDSKHPPPTLWREERFGFGWKPVAIGYGCGMIFGIALGCIVLLMGKPQWIVRIVGG